MHFVEAFATFFLVGFPGDALGGVDLDRFARGGVAHIQRAFFTFAAPEHARTIRGDRVPDIATLVAQCSVRSPASVRVRAAR